MDAVYQTSILPGICLLCGAINVDLAICEGCQADLPRTCHGCNRCGEAIPAGGHCGRCQIKPPPYDRLISAYDYSYPVDRLIQGLKYRQALPVARALAGGLVQRLLEQRHDWPDIIVPVPLHRRRLWRRGYNQALEVARILGRELGLNIDSGLVRRVQPTREQARLDRQSRRRNLRHAFELVGAGHYHRVAIVDDVVTTGTTASELAGLLRRSGVMSIQVWCLARATIE